MTSATDIRDRARDWVAAGIIDSGQAARIADFEQARDGVAPTSSMRDRTAGSLGVLGGLLVGLGVLLTVAANWSSIGDTGKVTTIILALVAAHAAGTWADARGAAHWVGTTAFVVATFVFAGGVFLLGQLFHVRAHDPLGFLVVAIAASAVALLASRMTIGWIAAAAWLAWGTHEFVDLLFEEDDVLSMVGACLLLGVTTIAAGWVLDGIASRHLAASAAGDRPLTADLHVLGTPLRSIALAGLLGLLVPLSFLWHVEEDLGDAGFDIPALVAAAVTIVMASLVARFADLEHRRLVAAALAVLVAVILVLSAFPDGDLIGIVANIVLVAIGIALALLGLAEDRRGTYAWGVAWIIVTIVARYVDVMLAFEFGGLGFIGAGVLLIGCGWLVGRSRHLWRTREEF